MKILHFYKTYYPDSYGGVQQVIFQLAEGASAHGIHSDVLFLSASDRRYNEPFGQHRVHSSSLDLEVASTGFSWEVIKRFKRLAHEADIIHYHFPWPFMDVVHLLSAVNKPSLVTYHSDIVKQKLLLKLYRPLMHRFLGQVDAIVAASPAYIQHSQVLRRYQDKTHVIPFGLDEASYPVARPSTLEAWRAKLPKRFFLFVGALRYYKGLQFLLEAAALNKLPVVIAGSGGIEAQLHQQARALKLENVIFTGSVSDIDKAALLQLCTVFVFPSHLPSEAFGISLLEAAMYAKPLISSEIGTGTTFVNLADQTGLAVPPANAQALAHAMQRLWDDQAMAERFGQQARRRFEQCFTAEAMASAYVALYQQLALKSPLPAPVNACAPTQALPRKRI